MANTVRWYKTHLIAAAGISTLSLAAAAQEGGITFGGVLSHTVEADTNAELVENSPGTEVSGTTRVTAGWATETRTDRLALETSATLRTSREGDGDTAIDATLPAVELSYSRDVGSSAVSSSAFFRESLNRFDAVVGGAFDDDGAFEPTDDPEVVERVGRRQVFGWSGAAAVGVGGHATLELEGNIAQTRFTGDGNTNDDFLRGSGGVATELRFSSVLTGRFAARGEVVEVDGGADRERFDLTSQLTYAATETLSFNALAGYYLDRTTEAGAEDVVNGFFGSLGAQVEQSTRTLGGSAGFELVDDELFGTASLSLDQSLPRGSFGVQVALDASNEPSSEFVGGFSLTYDLTRALALRAGLNRGLRIGNDGSNQITTTGRLDLSQSLSEVDSVVFGLDYAQVEGISDEADDSISGAVRIDYRRALSRRADLTVGYSYRVLDESGADLADSHRVQVGISIPFGG